MKRADDIDHFNRVRDEIGKVIIGQARNIELVLMALIADGHVLLEGVPGLAKTLMVSAVGKAIGGRFKRIQMIPDMLPSDIVGTYIYADGRLVLQHGPLHDANLVLADEINRSPARTQAALLEAMQERQITVLGRETFPLNDPFMVLATMNPIEQEGTYRLPESQLDRFLLKIVLDYIGAENEKTMVKNIALDQRDKLRTIRQMMEIGDILKIRENVRQEVRVSDSAIEYMVRLVDETRKPAGWDEDASLRVVRLGASPRAIFALRDMARVIAYMKDRDYVLPEDLEDVLPNVLPHRIILEFRAEAKGWTPEKVIQKIREKVLPA
jgi:MoxR-like ATPase